MIKLQVIGNLGRDCTENDVNGRKVINFVVAHNRKIKDQDKTTWIDCAYWTEKTAIANYLKKGTTVYVEGTPDVRTYQSNDGNFGASLTLRVQTVQLLGSRNPINPTSSESNTSISNDDSPSLSHTTQSSPEETDDLPF